MILERILIEMLGRSLPEQFSLNSTNDVPTVESKLFNFRPSSEFHVGMLSISLLVGLAYAGFVSYSCWKEQSVFLSYVRNLIIALVVRTFFTLLFDSVIILTDPLDWEGSNTLSSLECISTNLVIAFWLLFTIYIHARCKRNFNNEPSLSVLYDFGVPGVSIFYSLVWIFAIEGQYKKFWWWGIQYFLPVTQWIEASTRLLYLLIQLGLLVNMAMLMIPKMSSFDNDSKSLLWKVALLMGVLTFIYWLRFGLNVGRPSSLDFNPYLYFYYFIDGLQCAMICPIFYFFNRWVMVINKICLLTTNEEQINNKEIVIGGKEGNGIYTISSVSQKEQKGRWKYEKEEETKDIVYSSVIQPENLKKTIELYKRLNALPKNDVVVVNEEEFYDCCSLESLNTMAQQAYTSQSKDLNKPFRSTSMSKFRNNNGFEMVQKKNAFYSSKYLIVESKENHPIPNYLETRPSVTSSERGSLKSERNVKNQSARAVIVQSDDFLEKWLENCSDGKDRSSLESLNFEWKSGNFTKLNRHKQNKNNQSFNSDKKIKTTPEESEDFKEEKMKSSGSVEVQSNDLLTSVLNFFTPIQREEKPARAEIESKPTVVQPHIKIEHSTNNKSNTINEKNNPTYLENTNLKYKINDCLKKVKLDSETKVARESEIPEKNYDKEDKHKDFKKNRKPRSRSRKREINVEIDQKETKNIESLNKIRSCGPVENKAIDETLQLPEKTDGESLLAIKNGQIYDVSKSQTNNWIQDEKKTIQTEMKTEKENWPQKIQHNSDSEFDIEKQKKLSQSSSTSSTFSLDCYYTKLTNINNKFRREFRA